MAELFLEIFCEEIPARMQAKAERDLQDAILKGLREAGLGVEKAVSMSGPRRLAVICEGVPAGSDDVTEERKGPKVGAPDKAIEGFLRGAGLSSIDEAEVRSDPKKGDFYIAKRTIPGRATPDIVSELIPEIMRNFHWPKSMRTGRGELRWVRPLQRIVCLFDGQVVPFELDGIASGNETEGHRVHGRGPFRITGVDDYVTQLAGDGHVLLTREARREKIETEARAICETAGLELVEDKGLLEEIVGLAEWPVVILGEMDPAFLELPPEVIQLSMRTHQKYFAVRDPKTGTLAPNFVVVANIDAADGGKAIAAGNRKVLSARLEDGRFFWENDKKTGLDAMAPKLGKIDFKKELGTIADKVERVAALARELAPKVGADPDLAERAARLAKADLVSEMVYEFPELQGVMGRYYALEALKADRSGLDPEPRETASGDEGERPRIKSGDTDPWPWFANLEDHQIQSVADAIRDHYKPQGPSDAVPNEPVSIAVALADKLDTLSGFWVINEKPTGSKDPFALRRAALGMVRLSLENGVRIPLSEFFLMGTRLTMIHLHRQLSSVKDLSFFHQLKDDSRIKSMATIGDAGQMILEDSWAKIPAVEWERDLISDLLAFFADRLKQYLRDQGQRHDLIDAVFALGEDDLVLIVKRVEALAAFLDSEDGANLLAGYKRAANILRAEEKKDKRAFDGPVDAAKLSAKAETALHTAVVSASDAARTALEQEDFAAAMSALASLRAPVDAFFDGPDSVMVNADDAAIRENRLNLLNMMREAIGTVADFSKIEG
ncbi:MAG: glycine--tRNA ligase subunit beta [Hyphomonas sp.]|nr:glycine--tRNA ligase subunit beta [Hyphomonas sp.]